MAVNPISSSSLASTLATAQPERNEVHRGGQDARRDGDGDDGATATATATAAATKPTTNTSGQTVGTIINTTT